MTSNLNQRGTDAGRTALLTGRHGEQATEVLEVLREDIVSGRLQAGSVLRQQLLAERFGVSRMPIREALYRLEAEGFISFTPNKGAMVAPVSAADLQEIYEMRVAAETLALRLALPELTNAQIGRAEDLQEKMESAPVADFGRLNAAFHTTLYQPCARPRLLAHIENLSNAADRYLRMTVSTLDYAKVSHGEHRALLDACWRRDEMAAIESLTRHIEDAGRKLHERLLGSP
ncbi:GntR family transcriptional regulator [Denitrobaculum tricleocarpae]|uniref:GntR family transcriptional regulator n=1 Tax=Denitrobaculum tricleocarpae TaxID=2591009 RepID=A0A545TYQ3_9PROT|nr:GntR family transcriptional regulator [Denitrobaculum tricleocarpae]TQV82303.1 GntR family transcriptional regulator [Denitrobaculum tricleocarpae]